MATATSSTRTARAAGLFGVAATLFAARLPSSLGFGPPPFALTTPTTALSAPGATTLVTFAPETRIRTESSLSSHFRSSSLRMLSSPSAPDLSDLRVMVNGMPGPMAVASAEACLRRGLDLTPVAITGPDVPEQTITVTDPDTGRSADVKLVPSSNEEEVGWSVDGLKTAQGPFNLVAIDFTHPTAVNSNAEFYVDRAIPFVMGTTGGDREKLMATVEDAGHFAVIAPNMGKQIVAMQSALEWLAENFPGSFEGYSLEVTESHQKTKADTSGTAKAVIASIQSLTGDDSFDLDEDVVKLRNDEDSLAFGVSEEALGGHAFHTYTLTSPDKSVQFQLKHNVSGRRVYADGTADAVVFLAKKMHTEREGQVYTMINVLEEGALK